MKKYFCPVLLSVILLLVTACPMGNMIDDWNGKLPGEELFRISKVVQDSDTLLVTVTMDEELVAANINKNMYLWMSPIFDIPSDDAINQYRFKNIMFPVARQEITAASTRLVFDISPFCYYSWLNIGLRIKYNWSTNLMGCYFFVSNGVNGIIPHDVGGMDIPFALHETIIDNISFKFYDTRPDGNGYSNLRIFPDTNETLAPFIIDRAGLSLSANVCMADEIIYIMLKTSDPDPEVLITDNAGYSTVLNLTNLYLSHTYRYLWKVIVNPTLPQAADTICLEGIIPGTLLNFSYASERSRSIQFLGSADCIYETDFDGDNSALSYNPITGNNWHIAPPCTEEQYLWANPDNQVLGVGSTGVSDPYDINHDDSVIFPPIDFYTLSDGGKKGLIIHFLVKIPYNFGNYYKMNIEIQNIYRGWDILHEIPGKMYDFPCSLWWPFSVALNADDLNANHSQQLRFRSLSLNEKMSFYGLNIDNFKIYLTEPE